MSNSANPFTANDVAVRFSSLASLRDAHRKLLKQYRKSRDAPEPLDEVEKFICQGRATGALLDTDDARRTSQSILDYWCTVLYRAEREAPDATLAEFDPTLAPELDEADCPYLGLAAFGETNSNLFFGRQQLIEDLLNHLKEKRLLIVVGPADSGKVSLVLAGLLPALKNNALPGSKYWRYYEPIVPGADPLKNLAQLFQPAGTNTDEWTQRQVKGFRENPKHLVQLISGFGDLPVVLVVYRLREVFLLCQDDKARQAFIDNLFHLIQTPKTRHTLIITLQSDFGRSLEKEVLDSLFEKDDFKKAIVQVPSLNASELREVIEKPADLVGLKLDKRVVEELIKETLREPVGLPLLQFTLLQLWKKRKRNRITWESYKLLGGVREVLVNGTETFYEGLSHEEQLTARNILLRMVRGEVSGLARRQVPKSELVYSDLAENQRVEKLIKRLSAAHLIVEVQETEGDEPYVELTHDALVQEWVKLKTWAEGSAQALEDQLLRQRIRATVKQWKENKKDKNFLWNDDPGLDRLNEVLKSNDNWLNKLETEFVLNCDDQKRKDQLKHIGLAVLGLILLVFLIFFENELSGKENELSVKKNELRKKENQSSKDIQAKKQLSERVENSSASVTFSSDGAKLAWAGRSGIYLLDIERDQKKQIHISEDKSSISVAFNPQNSTKLAWASNSGIHLWDITTGKLQRVLLESETIYSVAFSSGGTSLASASKDGTIRLWDITTNKLQRVLLKDRTAQGIVTFNPADNRSLASASKDGTVRLWDIKKGQARILSKDKTGVNSIAFNSDGRRLAWATNSGINLWDVTTGQLKVLSKNKTAVLSIAFNSDGTSLASTSKDGTIWLWDITTGQARFLRKNKTAVLSITFSPPNSPLGKSLVSANDSGIVQFPIVNVEKTSRTSL